MISFKQFRNVMIHPISVMVMIVFLIFSYVKLDQPLVMYFYGFNLNQHAPILNWITKLGYGTFYLIAFFLAGLFFRYVYVRPVLEARSWFLWLCVTFSGVICAALKVSLGRARPTMFFHMQEYGFYWFQTHVRYWSFPSGHTTTVMAIVFGLSFLFPRHWLAFVISGLLLASTRILLVQHYLSDVIAASYLSLLEISFLVYMLRHRIGWAGKIQDKLKLQHCFSQ